MPHFEIPVFLIFLFGGHVFDAGRGGAVSKATLLHEARIVSISCQ